MKLLDKAVKLAKHLRTEISETVNDLIEYHRYCQPTPEEREADRQQRERERQHAEAKRQHNALVSGQQAAHQYFVTNIVPCLHLELFQVAYRAHSRMAVLQPMTLANLLYRVTSYNGLQFLNVALTRVEMTPMPQSSLDTIRDITQSMIWEDLVAGCVEGCSCACFYQGVPAIVVDRVRVDGPRLVFTLGVTNTEAAVRRWQLQQAAQPLPTAPAVAFDDFC